MVARPGDERDRIESKLRTPSTPMNRRELLARRLGLVEYGAALALQKETERAVLSGAQPDTLLLLEHPHVITVGRRGHNTGLLLTPEALESRGVFVFETNRGGKLTYHGLGQVVGY